MLQSAGARKEAPVSNRPMGQTFEAQCYPKLIGTTNAEAAIKELYKLLVKMSDGVSLLVFVMSAPRITATSQKNYQMFYDHFCQKNVPIVLVVTRLEHETLQNEENKDVNEWSQAVNNWIVAAEPSFTHYDMTFNKSIGVVATKGSKRNGAYRLAEEYKESMARVERAIMENCAENPWKMDGNWFVSVVRSAYHLFAEFFDMTPVGILGLLHKAFLRFGEMTEEAARKAAYDAKW